MRYFVGVSSALLAGIGIGIMVGTVLTEDKYRKEYRESTESFKRAMEQAAKPSGEAPAKTEEELVPEPDAAVLVSPVPFQPETVNPYHAAVEAVVEDAVEPHIEAGVHDYAISYIEAEDYEDEGDGYEKEQITILMDEHNPIFLMGGAEIRDWDERVGDSILVDFYKNVPPGAEPVLYVRNHKTNTDYEVIRDQP